MAYAQHQSFYLRDKWISKGLRFVNENPLFFQQDDAFEQIGLGKNMVQSLRFWLTATNLIEMNENRGYILTRLGRIILQNDRLLMKKSTAAIIHFNLVKNLEDKATVFEWFFNDYIESVFTREQIEEDFSEFVAKREVKEISAKTLKRDTDCLIQLYTKGINEKDPEDVIFSPLKKLGLIEETKKTVRKLPGKLENIGNTALYYVLLKYAQENDNNTIGVDEIVSSRMLWGKVFNLTRSEVVDALKELTTHARLPIIFVRTNNIDCIMLHELVDAEVFLEIEFENGDVK